MSARPEALPSVKELDAAVLAAFRQKFPEVGPGIGTMDELLRSIAARQSEPPDPLARIGPYERVRLAMVSLATITCQKCGRVWHEPLPEKWFVNHYGKVCVVPTSQTAPRCSKCSPPPTQPQEGDTFRPRGTARGKFILLGSLDLDSGGLYWNGESIGESEPRRSMDELLSDLALKKSWVAKDQAERNRESQERERIMTPEWVREQASPEEVRRAYQLLTNSSRAKIAQLFDIPEHIVRAGKTPGVLALLEAARSV